MVEALQDGTVARVGDGGVEQLVTLIVTSS